MNNNFSIVLLAAGVSSRFWPFREKYGFSFFGKTILARQIEIISSINPEKIVVVANKQNEPMVKQALHRQQKNVSFVCQQGEGQ